MPSCAIIRAITSTELTNDAEGPSSFVEYRTKKKVVSKSRELALEHLEVDMEAIQKCGGGMASTRGVKFTGCRSGAPLNYLQTPYNESPGPEELIQVVSVSEICFCRHWY